MIIRCESIEDAYRIIEEIKKLNKIINFHINTTYGCVYIILDGAIQSVTDDYLDKIGANKVFSSLTDDLFFVNGGIEVPPIRIGNRKYTNNDMLISVIAGPCAIEGYEELYSTAIELKKAGVSIFRAMPNKPRTSPYNFQGVGKIGWNYLKKIKDELGLPVLAEVFNQEEIDIAVDYDIDLIQIGSRNMQNYDLIKRAAQSGITTVLKKGMWCNNTQLMKASEYFFVYGNGNVILSERGIQTWENMTRNTFDAASVFLLKEKTKLPVMADASHGTGIRNLVSPVNCAAVLLGADLIEVEVHVNPDSTIKPGDYYQMLNIGEYKEMLKKLEEVMNIIGKKFDFS